MKFGEANLKLLALFPNTVHAIMELEKSHPSVEYRAYASGMIAAGTISAETEISQMAHDALLLSLLLLGQAAGVTESDDATIRGAFKRDMAKSAGARN